MPATRVPWILDGMSKRHNQLTNHHALPKSRDGSNNKPNTRRIKDSVHRAIHTLFQNETFTEKLETLLCMDADVLTDEIKRRVYEIIEIPEDEVYIKEAYKQHNDKHDR